MVSFFAAGPFDDQLNDDLRFLYNLQMWKCFDFDLTNKVEQFQAQNLYKTHKSPKKLLSNFGS